MRRVEPEVGGCDPKVERIRGLGDEDPTRSQDPCHLGQDVDEHAERQVLDHLEEGDGTVRTISSPPEGREQISGLDDETSLEALLDARLIEVHASRREALIGEDAQPLAAPAAEVEYWVVVIDARTDELQVLELTCRDLFGVAAEAILEREVEHLVHRRLRNCGETIRAPIRGRERSISGAIGSPSGEAGDRRAHCGEIAVKLLPKPIDCGVRVLTSRLQRCGLGRGRSGIHVGGRVLDGARLSQSCGSLCVHPSVIDRRSHRLVGVGAGGGDGVGLRDVHRLLGVVTVSVQSLSESVEPAVEHHASRSGHLEHALIERRREPMELGPRPHLEMIQPALDLVETLRDGGIDPSDHPTQESLEHAAERTGRSASVPLVGSILVTGGAGYIGSHTVRALRAADREVVVIDTLELGRADAVIDATLIQMSVDDPDVEQVCRDHDVTAVVHFAAYKNVGESMRNPTRYFRNNVAGTIALLDAVLRAGVQRFVFSSSCSVVGTPQHVPVDESAPIGPESVYAETKAMMERTLEWYATTGRLRHVSLRYFNAAGASSDAVIGEDWSFSQNLVPLAMKAALLGSPSLKVFGDDYDTPDGTCIRDYIHVEDLADAHLRALEYLESDGLSTVVNVGTGTGSSVLEVIRAIEQVTDSAVPHEIVGRREGDPVAIFADPTRATEILGWAPRHGLDHIIRTAYHWHRRQVAQTHQDM